jgi:transcriptional regulator of met regulon
LKEPDQGSAEAIYVPALVDEMMRRVLEDAFVALAKARGAAYLDMFVERELARYADLFRERPDDTPETTGMLRAWFMVEGSAALRAVVERANAEARRD